MFDEEIKNASVPQLKFAIEELNAYRSHLLWSINWLNNQLADLRSSVEQANQSVLATEAELKKKMEDQ